MKVDASSATATINLGNFTLTNATAQINGGTGINAITGTNLADTIDAGTGADTVSGGGGLDTYKFDNGDSTYTIGGTGDNGTIALGDVITGYALGTGATNAETLDGVTQTYAVGAIAAAVDSNLTVGGAKVDTSETVVTNGVAAFKLVGGAAITINSAAKLSAVVEALSLSDIGAAGSSLAFVGAIGGAATTYVYTQTTAAASGANGDIIALAGVTGTSMSATNANTAGLIHIA